MTEKTIFVRWIQNDAEGKPIECEKSFSGVPFTDGTTSDPREDAELWKKQMEVSAQGIREPFKVIEWTETGYSDTETKKITLPWANRLRDRLEDSISPSAMAFHYKELSLVREFVAPLLEFADKEEARINEYIQHQREERAKENQIRKAMRPSGCLVTCPSGLHQCNYDPDEDEEHPEQHDFNCNCTEGMLDAD